MVELLAIALLLVVATPAAAVARPDFRTPRGAAYCDSTPDGFYCWTPNDGFTVIMAGVGHAVKAANGGYLVRNRGRLPHAKRTLRFGERWHGNYGRTVRCFSRRRGLTCRNRSGHGWWLGRYRGYRIF